MTLIAGLARRDISPREGVDLGGYPYFVRFNEGVHDPLWANALYLANEGAELLILATDLFWLTRAQADRVIARIAAASQLSPAAISLSCSHSHSAPWMNDLFGTENAEGGYRASIDESYTEFVIEQLAETGLAALRRTFPAQVALTKTRCGRAEGVGGNRRAPETGPVDDELPLLLLRDAGGTLRAVYTKYALHPTILHGENRLVSADYPGAIRRHIQAAHPGAAFLFSLGAAGDQSPRYYRRGQDFAEVERFGRVIAERILAATEGAQYRSELVLKARAADFEPVLKYYPAPDEVEARLRALREEERRLIAAGAGYTECQTANLWVLGAECDLKNARLQAEGLLEARCRDCAPFTLKAFRIGEAVFLYLPGEIFVDFALEIKARSPYPDTHVITLANGTLPGYCVTEEALAEGGYEPWNSILSPETGRVMVEAALALIAQL